MPAYLILWLQIGGVRAPSPVGELGNVEMTQAVSLVDTQWQAVGPDMLLEGVLHCLLLCLPAQQLCHPKW